MTLKPQSFDIWKDSATARMVRAGGGVRKETFGRMWCPRGGGAGRGLDQPPPPKRVGW